MNEIKPVSDLIMSVIGIAIALGVAGTLFDATNSVGKNASRAIAADKISYLRWNNNLHDPIRPSSLKLPVVPSDRPQRSNGQ